MSEALARLTRAELGAVTVSVASIADLIVLKEMARRAKDREDIEALKALLEEGIDDG